MFGVYVQGDFIILSLQAGRLLLKVVGQRMAGETPRGALTSSVRHLYTCDLETVSKPQQPSTEELLSPQWIVQAFERR